ncbi:hypothetical protein ASPCAL10998 [Aspergillus calidoustus]|uniref:Myb-like domain-containing protein n=1 Tax=Aspergillus calidoustus TaxID=454130 RepID=A0A0U5H219_ASPCI|nr:hypothetical protein ASPCAL10998 [Aspergillus calidoustus]
MDPKGIYARSFDESLIRELPHLRIAPLREPVPSRSLRTPSTLEPNASGSRESNALSKAGVPPPRNHEPSGPVLEGHNASRLKKNDYFSDSLSEPPPPRPILPAFVNLRALERFPYSSFDDDGVHSRKRRRVDIQSDTFGEHLQLPFPQAQKEQRPPPFGPFAILNGLNEPPPNAALLPPIEPGSITQLLTKPSRDSTVVEPAPLAAGSVPDTQSVERVEGRIADILDSPIAEKPNFSLDTANEKSESAFGSGTLEKESEGAHEPISPKTRGRSRKNLRKWTDEETISLLRGVVKCGIGNWKEILAQPELNFNKRSASNLKDRFRVCCPWAYRASDPEEALSHLRDALAKAISKAESDTSGKLFSKSQQHSADSGAPLLLTGTPDLTPSGSMASFSSIETSRSSGEHNLPENCKPTLFNPSESTSGIPEQPVKCRRRVRRPFTAAEDEALLKGYAVHGFQWTLIQQDKRLNLGHRRATDLRDRFRTKFPHAYRDGGSVSGGTLLAQMAKDYSIKDGKNGSPEGEQRLSEYKRTRNLGKPNGPNGLGTLDAAMPSLVFPLATRESSAYVPSAGFSFPLDDNSTIPVNVDLPPLIWDDIP